jgi:sterol desaturase/sphingolipid hydroxylase (fatty acid hydroxylase superfamily)
MTALTTTVGVVLGLTGWSLAEYALHRWGFHHRHRDPVRSLVAREHRLHHREPLRTSAVMRSLAWVGVAASATPVLLLASPWSVGLWLGWVGGYTCYDRFHWRAHHRRPRNRYEVRLRRRHDLHHHGHPRANYGVTSDVWDRVFGTRVTPPAPSAAP